MRAARGAVRDGTGVRCSAVRTAILGLLAAWTVVSGLVASRADDVLGRGGVLLTVRLVRPEDQGGRLIGLFRGSRAPDPAAALAAWKHATGGRGSLGKPLE